jgi:hypothetical protein
LPAAPSRWRPAAARRAIVRYIEAAVGGLLVGCLYLPNGNPAPGPKFDYKLRLFERLTGYSQSLLDSGAPAPISRGTGSSNPSPASGESGANPGSREAARVLCRMNDRLFASLWKIARPRLVVAYQEHGARPSPMWQHRRLQLSAGK